MGSSGGVRGSQHLISKVKTRLRSLRRREIGPPAPSFRVRTVRDSTTVLSDLHGDPVLLYFWARWCVPCRFTLPKLNELYANRGSDIHMLGLITDVNDRSKLNAFLEKQNFAWPQAITADWTKNTRSPERLYGIEGSGPPFALGHTVLIDSQGRIAAQGKQFGPIRDTLRTLLAH